MTATRDGFWKIFAERHWEREHLVAGEHFPAAPVTPEALFPDVVRSCDPALAEPAGVTLRYFLDGQPHLQPDGRIEPALRPRADDRSLEGYRARVRAETGKAFGLVITNIQAVSFPLFDFCRRFVRPLTDRVGIPNGGVGLELYFGERAPFPLHVDPDSVFHMPVYGRKRIRAWAPGAADVNPTVKGAFFDRYEPHLASSVLLETEPGGVLYWPSTYWHTGENKGELSASLALSLTTYEDPDRAMVQLLEYAAPGQANEVDLSAFLMENSGGKILRQLYLKLESAGGFILCPRPEPPVALRDDDVVRGDPEYPVRWGEGDDGVLEVSANGHLVEQPRHAGLESMLEALNLGEPRAVRQLLEIVGDDPAARASARALLVELVAFRALATGA